MLRASVSVLAGSDGLPLLSCDCAVITVEQLPAVTVTGEVVNTSFEAAAAFTVRV